jgi:hypothetical protein
LIVTGGKKSAIGKCSGFNQQYRVLSESAASELESLKTSNPDSESLAARPDCAAVMEKL